MGRFYKTAKPQFIEDMIYQPPWDLIKEALTTQQQDYDIALAKTDLFNNVDVNYIDDPVERQKVIDKQSYYNQKSEEIATKLQSGDTNEWRKNLPEIRKLTRELEADYKTGDIYKIQKSADMYGKMNEQLKTIKDPARREAAKKYYLDQWKSSPNRSMDKTFEYEDIFDKQDPTGEFISELKNSKPDIWAKATATTNGKYIDTKTTSREVLNQLDDAYTAFIDAKGYDPYFKQEQKLGFGTYYDEDGNRLKFTDPNSSVAKQIEYVKQFEYTQGKAEADKKVDAYGLEELQQKYKLEAAAYSASLGKAGATPVSFTKDASFYYNYTKEGKEVMKTYNMEVGKLAQTIGAKDPKDYDKYINVIRNNPAKYPQQFKYLTTLDNSLNINQRSGTDYFRNLGFNQDQIDIVDKKFQQKGIETTLASKDGYVDFGTINGKPYMSKGTAKGEKINLRKMIGKTIDMPGYTGAKIESIEIVKGTPSFMPATESDGKSGVATTILITPSKGEPFYAEYYISGDPLNIGF